MRPRLFITVAILALSSAVLSGTMRGVWAADYTVTASAASVSPGGALSVSWTAPAGRPYFDWIGLFKVGDPNTGEAWYAYTAGAASGTCNLSAPDTPGVQYEFRYFQNNGRADVARSGAVSIASGGGGAAGFAVTPSPSSCSSGAALSVTWTAPSGRPQFDWVGLFRSGDPNTAELWYAYTGGAASGTCNLSAPMQGGQYEFRYFLNNTRTDVARSSAVTVSSSATGAGFTVTGSPTSASPGGALAVSWTAPAGRPQYDWVGLFRVGDPNTSELWWQFTAGVPSGTYNLSAPSQTGQYEFRYFVNNSRTDVARSAAITVSTRGGGGGTAGGSVWLPPVNLRVKGVWQNASTDILSWDPVPGAVSYNLYQYDDLLVSGLTTTTYTVPTNRWMHGLTYAVTAVDSTGLESIPSNIVTAQDASTSPAWTPNPPQTPKDLTVAGEWNNGKPRLHVFWNGTAHRDTFAVYRDGIKVVEGLWGHHYYDASVQAGEQHSYAVSALNIASTTYRESSPTAAVSGTAPTAAPSPASGGVTITRVVPNDDSVMVYFNAVAGAVDYRVYSTANPGQKKYSVGALSVEMNGLNPATGADLVVEAVDKLGPFQKMDGFMGPGAMLMDGSTNVAVNGFGDPSNVPIVLASSGVFHVSCQARSLTGAQAFFDTFRGSQPFVASTVPQPMTQVHGNEVKAFENDKWKIYNVMGDAKNTRIFVMGNHFMDTVYDGGTPPTPVTHNNNASMVMQPKQLADISGGKVLHVTFEVDAHMDGRRWCDLILADANDTVIRPGLFAEFGLYPTVSGNAFRWEVTYNAHAAQIFRGSGGTLQQTNLIDNSFNTGSDYLAGGSARIRWDQVPLSNGTQQDLDKRHQFDLYLSQTRMRVLEDGRLVADKTFPAGVTLPFTQIAVYYVHQLYHTDNDRSEIMGKSENSYWINHRPWADERHWDNMGFEVLTAFPQ